MEPNISNNGGSAIRLQIDSIEFQRLLMELKPELIQLLLSKRSLVRDESTAEECFQETALSGLSMIHAGVELDRDKFVNWTRKVILNKARSHYRREKIRRDDQKILAYLELSQQNEDRYLGISSSNQADSVSVDSIQQALLHLPVQARWLWVAHHYSGIRQSALARQTGINPGDISELLTATSQVIVNISQLVEERPREVPACLKQNLTALPSQRRKIWGQMSDYLVRWNAGYDKVADADWSSAWIAFQQATRLHEIEGNPRHSSQWMNCGLKKRLFAFFHLAEFSRIDADALLSGGVTWDLRERHNIENMTYAPMLRNNACGINAYIDPDEYYGWLCLHRGLDLFLDSILID